MAIVSIIVAIGLLIALNALYVAAELSVVAVSPARIRSLADEGDAAARRLQPVTDDPVALDRYVAACQVGITVSTLVLGAYGEAELAPLLGSVFGALGGWDEAAAHSVAFAVILAGLSVAQMVLGELVPKTLALQYPDKVARFTVRPMAHSQRLLAPLVWAFNGSGLAILRLLRVRPRGERHIHTPAEIDLLLREAPGDGGLDDRDRRRLRRALRLSTRRAADLMSAREEIVAIEVETSLDEAARIGAEQPYTRFPVYRGDLDQPVGLLHTKDVVRAHARGKPATIQELLRPLVTVGLDAGADQLLVLLRERRASQALVVDDQQRVVGLLTMRDVLGYVFGALADEFKNSPAPKGRD